MFVGRHPISRIRHRVVVVLSGPAVVNSQRLEEEKAVPERHPPEKAIVKHDRGVVEEADRHVF